MRKYLKICALALVLMGPAVVSYAQPSKAPVSTEYEQYSQMQQPAKTYFNSVTAANLGQQIDTIATATTTYFAICKYVTPATVNNDSFYVAALQGGDALISFAWNADKISGTMAGSVTLQASDDGTSWNAVPRGNTAGDSTFTFTDVTAQGGRIEYLTKGARYYRFKVVSTGTLSFTFRSSYYWQRRYTISRGK